MPASVATRSVCPERGRWQTGAKEIVKRYPDGRQQSAVIPLLDLAQRECRRLACRIAAIEHVASDPGDMPSQFASYEVASPSIRCSISTLSVKTSFRLCRTTPCWLRGSDELTAACKRKLGIGLGETTADGKFTLVEVECLGACVNAPMIQINDDYYEDLSGAQMEQLLDDLASGRKTTVGSQTGRRGSEPPGGMDTLTDLPDPPVVKTLAFDKAADVEPAEKS